ncbi:MAG: ABC transporter ATP-binding protein [Lachnoclostridium sp.]|jgi:ABC-2 type transport system ATP-binding protein|nr:ABC transporter ATP-binding protein [Lachnoclostridium sp.]
MNDIILEAKNITKRFSSVLALNNFTVTLERGKIIGLLGPNGSGKTTMLKIINGLLVPEEGSVKIAGNVPGVDTKKIISYLPDKNYLSNWMTVKQLIRYYEDFYADFNHEKALDMISRLGITENMKFKSMSKGTKEKVQLVLVMSRNAELYCLDEPIGGVDPAARDYILHTILNNYSENATVLISTHLIYDIESVLDDVIFIQNGALRLHASVDQIREEKNMSIDALFREVYRC